MAHARGNFIWSLPPAVADVVLEQLSHARHKRLEAMHIVIVPRLMTGCWRQLIIRRTDRYARLLASGVWPLGNHCEPVLIFLALPFRSRDPQHRHRFGLLECFQWVMLGERLQTAFGAKRRAILWELFVEEARRFCPV
jgi:hypothetical protein